MKDTPFLLDEAPGGLLGQAAKRWDKLKTQSTLTVSLAGEKSWSPAVGRYKYLNKVWKPVHKIMFLDPKPTLNPMGLAGGMGGHQHGAGHHGGAGGAGGGGGGHQGGMAINPTLKVLITTLSVTSRPDLMLINSRQRSAGAKSKRAMQAVAAGTFTILHLYDKNFILLGNEGQILSQLQSTYSKTSI